MNDQQKLELRTKIDHMQRLASAMDLIFVMSQDPNYLPLAGQDLYTVEEAIQQLAKQNVLDAETLRKTWKALAQFPELSRGNLIRIGGWHPDSLDESNNHPQTHFEHKILGCASPGGAFEFLGTSLFNNQSLYQARRDITKAEWDLIVSEGNAVGLFFKRA